MRISTFIVFGGNYAPSSADMLRRTLSSTASSSSWTCRLNSGVMEKDWYPGRDSHLSTTRRIRLTQSRASAFVALAGNSCKRGMVLHCAIESLHSGDHTIPAPVLHAKHFDVGTEPAKSLASASGCRAVGRTRPNLRLGEMHAAQICTCNFK